jgi:hypothetical protein
MQRDCTRSGIENLSLSRGGKRWFIPSPDATKRALMADGLERIWKRKNDRG